MDRNAPFPRRRTPRPRRTRLAAALGIAALIAGCAQPGPISGRYGMIGALKANVAQLESEKEGLTRNLAEARSENRRIEAQLAEVEAQNGDLAARLDDARAVMSRQGGDDSRLSSSREASDADLGRAPTRRAAPVRTPPKGKKAPFAQIPSERRSVEDADDEPPLRDRLAPPRSRDDRDDFPAQSRLDDRSPWLPVARGRNSPMRTVR